MSGRDPSAFDHLHQGVFTPHLLVHALSHTLDRPVLHLLDGTTLTARDLRDITSQYCQALSALQIKPGCRIALLSGNKPQVLHVTHASLLNQYVPVALYPLGSLEDHLYMVEDGGVEVLIFDARFAERALAIMERSSSLRHLLSFGPAPGAVDLDTHASAFTPGPLHAPQLRGDEPIRLSYSGGTTGKPKAIVGTQSYFATMFQILMAEWEWPHEMRQLICAPLSHSGAPLFLPTLLRGGSAVVLPGFDPLQVLETIQRHRITCVLLVPTMIYALLDHPRLGEFDLSSLEVIFYGASAMSPARLREGIARLGPIFFQFYGQAEAPMAITVLRRAEHEVNDPIRLSSCGRPVPWVHVSLLGDEMREVPDGEPGEICVRGPLVMQGYLNKPEETAQALAGGWLHTGDIAIRDAQGYLRIVDRKKDMIISGGFNIYPREVEDVLGAHPAVAQCAVIGVADERWGEAVKAIVILRPEAAPCADDLIAWVREKKGAVQAPKSVDFVTEIPLTAVGKPDKKKLRERYRAFAKRANHG